MIPEYFETCFRLTAAAAGEAWPREFGIVSAYATTGERWSDERNQAADRELEAELERQGIQRRRLIGFSPTTEHAEPSWAVELSFDATCDLGLRFRQDAIYYVRNERLNLSYCDDRRGLIEVGLFRERLRIVGD